MCVNPSYVDYALTDVVTYEVHTHVYVLGACARLRLAIRQRDSPLVIFPQLGGYGGIKVVI